jgi:GNAT superfamily N-acetyltransferase
MEIHPLDVADPAATAAWHATYERATAFGQVCPTPWTLAELRADVQADRQSRLIEPFSGLVDGQVVVTGWLELSLRDNLDLADVEVATLPEHRRRGYGSAMLEHLLGRVVAHGRGTVATEATYSCDAPADGSGTPVAAFLARHGFEFSLADVKRVLDLPVDETLLDRLEKDIAAHVAGYTLRTFGTPVPEDLLAGFGALKGSLMVEAPQGELALQEEVFDAQRIREDEAVLAASGRRKHITVALAGDGEPVAYSEVAVPRDDPAMAYQWGTLVRPDHRGHRLGLATKLANLRRLQSLEPGRTLLVTYNAEVNRPMIAVNEALGFRPVERLGEFHRKV